MAFVELICNTILKIVSMILAVPILIAIFFIFTFACLLGLAVLIAIYIALLFISAYENTFIRK